MNNINLIGRTGKDSEEYKFEGGAVKQSFSLATSESYKNKDGEWVETTQWHNIIKFSKFDLNMIPKGSLIAVEGKVAYRNYEDKEGNTKYITEVLAHRIRNWSPKEGITTSHMNNELDKQEAAAGDGTGDDLPF